MSGRRRNRAGASLAADGADVVDAHMSNCALIPAEVIESTYPLRVERYALLTDSGGKLPQSVNGDCMPFSNQSLSFRASEGAESARRRCRLRQSLISGPERFRTPS